MKTPLSQKVLVLGIDGMDPMLTKSLLNQGKLPAIKEYITKGAAREDLVLLGALPTITPPMWTTLSTGAYPATYGITCFWGQDKENTWEAYNDWQAACLNYFIETDQFDVIFSHLHNVDGIGHSV